MSLTPTLTPRSVLLFCRELETRLAKEPNSELVSWLQTQLEDLKGMALSDPDQESFGGFTVADVQAIVPGTTDEDAEWILEKAADDFNPVIGVNETVLWCHAEALGLTLAQKEREQVQA